MVWIAIIFGILLLISFPRQMLAIGGFLVFLIAVGIFLLYLADRKQQREWDKEERERAQVLISVRYTLSNCTSDHPLLVIIRNSNSKTVAYVSWRFQAYRPGYSSDVTDGYLSDYSTDKILKTGETEALCYKMPTLKENYDPGTLNWEVTRTYVRFTN